MRLSFLALLLVSVQAGYVPEAKTTNNYVCGGRSLTSVCLLFLAAPPSQQHSRPVTALCWRVADCACACVCAMCGGEITLADVI